MPTVKAIMQEILRRAPADSLGRSVAISSLTVTTAVANSLATGTVSAQKFINKWLWRPDTATVADRYRICTNFAAATGTFTHAGTNYADTTAAGEDLLVLEYEPAFYLDAIQVALDRTKRLERTIIPTQANELHYPVERDFSWITQPDQVKRIALTYAPWLNNNRSFQQWGNYQSGGTLGLDNWTLAGASATLARGTTYVRRNRYSAELARVGTNCTLSQTLRLQLNGVSADDLIGETVFVVGVGLATVASRLRFAIVSGSTTGSTSYHTGDTTWQELSTSITIPTDAVDIVIRAEVNTGNTTAYIDELYALRTSALQDVYRRGQYEETVLRRDDFDWEQDPNGLALVLKALPGRDRQLVLYSERSYPQFSQSRLDAGSGDGDSTDCPVTLVATGAIARLYEGLAQRKGEDPKRYEQLANEWDQRYQQLALAHRRGVIRSSENPLPSPLLAVAPGRW